MKKLMIGLSLLVSIPSLATAKIECNKDINRIDGTREYHESTVSDYNPGSMIGIYKHSEIFELNNDQKIYFSVITQNKQNFIMARLQEEVGSEVKVLGYGETNQFKVDPKGNVELNLVVTNTELMQRLVEQKGIDSTQLKLMRSFNGSLGMKSIKSVEVSCEISGLN